MIYISALIFSIFLVQLSFAEEYSINDVLAFSLLKNPELLSFSYDMRAAEARILQAGLVPNPGLDVETENLGAPIFGQTTILLSQVLEFGGKRRSRVNFAKSERDRAALDYEVAKRQLYVDTGLLFIEALILQEKIAFLEENLKNLQAYSSIVEKRVKAGKASVIEESNFIVMLHTAHIDLTSAENSLRKAKSKLAAKWGEPCNDSFFIVGTLEDIPEINPLEEMGDWIQDHPEVVRSYYEDTVRLSRVALEKSKGVPDVNVRGGPRYLKEAKKWVWVVGLSMPLPIHDRNQGPILESQANLDKLEKEREAIWVRLLTELNTSYAAIQAALTELSILQNYVLPAAKKAYDFSYKGYEVARYNYLELIETERAYRNSRIRYLEALGEFHKALTVLQGLTGSKCL